MTITATPSLGRRRFVFGALAATSTFAMPSGLRAQVRVATPSSTAGPFYPVKVPDDVDNDLVVVRGAQTKPQGTVTHITGRVLGIDGRPLANAKVEIWQCDAHGIYLHPGSQGSRPRDSAFQGFGRTMTAADGTYSFRTIRPVPYSGRTPHIHFGVAAGKTELITQMYVAGEPLNARDFLYSSIRDTRQREAVTVRLESANGIENGALAGKFDLVLKV